MTVSLSVGGRVYSWGHAEYGQHGTGGGMKGDLQVSTFDFLEIVERNQDVFKPSRKSPKTPRGITW